MDHKHHHNPYTYRLLIAYEGACYTGWQVQLQGVSVQGELERVLTLILREPVEVVGSGRTDAGVHAMGQTAHIRISKEIDCRRVLHSLNALLPLDIRVKELRPAPSTFHARYSAIGKEYHYHLWLGDYEDPFKRRFSWHLRNPIDRARLKRGADILVGKHSFASFSNDQTRGAASRNPVRTLHRLDIVEQEGGLRLELEADGFLYKMVRNIVGTIVIGSLEGTNYPQHIDNLEAILAAEDRKLAGMAAPPQGLFLMRVDY
jgi:tRNA pseudouridine38-40 synthase